MCGRYATARSSGDLARLFDAVDETDGRLVADFNVAPTDPVPVVRWGSRQPGGRALTVARWGLVPHWARDPRSGPRMINARAETVATSAAYAPSFAHRRCLVPADGWYEWVRLATGRKQPYFMTPADGGVLAFAGLWAAAGELVTCTIVTVPAAGGLAAVHHRMPLVLSRDRWPQWLRGAADDPALLAPPSPDVLAALEIRPVGPAVGDVRNDGPHLVARVDTFVPRAAGHDNPEPTLF